MNGHHANISVHIVTYNNQNTIASCLSALFDQSFKNFTVCLIDNNSSDETIKKIRSFKNIHVIQNLTNIGYAAAHNQALSILKSKYVLTLNPDVILEKHFLQSMVTVFEKGPSEVGSAAGLLYRINSIHDRSAVVDGAGLYLTRSRRQRLWYEGATLPKNMNGQTDIFGPDGAAAIYRREMLEDINIGNGIFDEDFFMHKEDVDVCWRAQLRGWKSVFVPNAVAYHIRTFRAGQRKNIDSTMRMLAVRNRYYLMIKNELPVLFWRDIFWIGAYDVGILLYVLFFERTSIPAYVQVMQNIPKMIQKRMSIQRSKKVNDDYMSQWFRWGQL